MVHITPVLAGAVALSVLTSVNALPAAQGSPTAAKKSGPMAVQAKPMQTLTKKSYVGGGHGMKRLRQAPMMKPSRLVKLKRSLSARDEHVHIHEHDHDHEHHHHAANYDPNHSEHWNYHHGRISDDKHHNHHSRSLINIQALNLGSNVGRHGGKHILQCSGSHYHCDNKKRGIDDVSGSVDKLLGKGEGSKKKEGTHTKSKSGSEEHKKRPEGKHAHGSAGVRNFSKEGKKHKGGKRSHDDHYYHGDHYYGDGHDHDHDHDHDHAHIHEHNHKRDHADHSDHYYAHHDMDRHHHHEDNHVHIHDHSRRQLSNAGVPGFVEVASTLFHSNLAKSVAGLVFSKDPDTNSSDFVLGTSDSQSTQFYLAPYTAPSGASPYAQLAVDNSNSTSAVDPEASAATYQLRIPVLDSSSQTTNDYCATFDVQPPSPLSMQPCSELDGYSQVFGYNATTGELTPIYPASSTQPTPLNAAVKIGNPQVLAAESFGNNTASFNGTATDDDSDDVASAWSSNSTASPSAPLPTATSTPSSTPKVSLYFIPSAAYYTAPDSIDSLAQARNASVADASSTTSAASSLFTPAPAAIKAVNYNYNNDGSNYDDGSDGNDDDDAVYTTVTITTTVSADSAAQTGSSDYQTFDGQSGRNNAVIADGPESDGSDDGQDSSDDGSDSQGWSQPTPTSNSDGSN